VVTFPTVVLILLTEILRLVTGLSNMSMLVPFSERDRESACSVKARTIINSGNDLMTKYMMNHRYYHHSFISFCAGISKKTCLL